MKHLCNSKYPWKEAYQVLKTCNLDGIPMNIYEENCARNFRVQSECEWTLVQVLAWLTMLSLTNYLNL